MPSNYGYPQSRERYAKSAKTSYGARTGGPPQRRNSKASKIVLGLLYIVFTFALALFIFKSPFFFVRREKISGLSALTPQEANRIIGIASIPAKTNLFLLKSAQIQNALNQLPFIHTSNIRKIPPGTLIFQITPRTPVAALICPNGKWELDSSGEVIRPLVHPNLPVIQLTDSAKVIVGQPVNDPGVEGGILILNQYKPMGNIGISKIEVDQNGDICLNMQDHILIRIGPADQLRSKVATLERIYQLDQDIASRVQAINLICNDAIACTPRGVGNTIKPGMTSKSAIPTQ